MQVLVERVGRAQCCHLHSEFWLGRLLKPSLHVNFLRVCLYKNTALHAIPVLTTPTSGGAGVVISSVYHPHAVSLDTLRDFQGPDFPKGTHMPLTSPFQTSRMYLTITPAA